MKNEKEIYQHLQLILSRIMPSYPKEYWCAESQLFGELPEFDSMAIINLIGELEDCFDIELDDEDVTADNFETVASIVNLLLSRNV